ncbi:MAG: transglycosylase SLT domain-containing protein, partial [Nitrospinaceae bacterium]
QFQENVRRWPQGVLAPQNLFWAAKFEEKRGQRQTARQRYSQLVGKYPFTYYGLRAEQKLSAFKKKAPPGQSPRISKTGYHPAAAPAPGLPRTMNPRERGRYVRAKALAEIGLYEEARLEAKKLSRSIRKNLSGVLWLSQLFLEVQAYPEALRVLDLYRTFKTLPGEKDLPLHFWKNFYPLPYQEFVAGPAGHHSIDPLFVHALIRQESQFDAGVVSTAGARGLMQIMPKTGNRLFTPDGKFPEFAPETLFDPDLNLRLGIKYLDQLRRRFGRNGVHTLIAYNAGPHVLKKWLRRFKGIEDEDVFIESIPYQETRRYVQHVLRNFGIYGRLYGASRDPEPANNPF